MAKTFRDALSQAIEQTATTWSAVASATGVSYEQLKKLKQGKSQSTNVDDAVKIANHFGMTLDEFIDDQTRYQREEILDLLRTLKEQERDLLIAAARGMRDQGRKANR
ncbi:helix-turn-helix domain-containing protein [Pseudooceanicola nitratireducens]|uniref:helix-turn-helix domain-containing protein n=1 Tax=Pseudooceanicola nitratireducens TaxID=517719 RepID=UPI003C7BEFD7